MELIVCNISKGKMSLNILYKLRHDTLWRWSKIISCHKVKDELDRIIKVCMTVALLFISFVSLSQTLSEKRTIMVDSINYFREDPVQRVNDAFGITLNKNKFKPTSPYIQDKALTRSAQRWADKMARTGHYWHSRTKNTESIDAIQQWQGGYELSVARFIIDRSVRDKGHRMHMLSWPDTYIGIGIAVTKEGETYVCVQTN